MLSRLIYCCLLNLALSVTFLNLINIAKSEFTASVVEYQSINNSSLTPVDQINANTANYIQLLESVSTADSTEFDFIVYPEGTLYNGPDLNEEKIIDYSTYVKRDQSPCNLTKNYPKFMQDLSCAAKEHRTFLVVNLIEKEKCSDDDKTSVENCKRYGHYLYNTNVIFDENGVIVDRYRKFHLFAEDYLNKPKSAEKVIFQIKNHTFGTFTCFDILFEEPALSLVHSKVDYFVFPTMWFSELPFLTALQVQMMWTVENGVTLFASGANNPSKGSGGTGIYNTYIGDLVSDIIADGGQNVYSAQISDYFKSPTSPTDNEIDKLAKEMDKFKLTSSNFTGYRSLLLNTSATSTETYQVCTDEFCCDFKIKFDLNSAWDSTRNHYTYLLVAYSGDRSFSGYANVDLEICAVIACLNSTLDSCGQRFPNYDSIDWKISFTELVVGGYFTNSTRSKQYPNSLISSIRPLSPFQFQWARMENGIENSKKVRRQLSLNEPQNRLLTFGIFGIKYKDPNTGNVFKFNIWILLVAIFISYVVL